MTLTITRVVNSSVLIEADGLAVLTDPWFTERWHIHRAEPLGLTPADLPPLDLIVGSNPFVNHWDIRGLRAIRSKGATVVSPNRRMSHAARHAGFANRIRLRPGASTTVGPIRIDSFPGGGFGPATSVYVLTIGSTRIMFGGEAGDVSGVAGHGPVDIALLPVNGLTAFGRSLVMSAAEAVEAAAAAGAHTLIPIHDAHADDLIWRFIRRRSTASDCLAVRDRIAPGLRVLDVPTGERVDLTQVVG
jgi:L-ascorbate metabolism protein UlaG (beta-lactamase superfamily)